MVLAARGLRNLDDGKQRIEDEAERADVRRLARKVHLQTNVVAVGLTAFVYFLPW